MMKKWMAYVLSALLLFSAFSIPAAAIGFTLTDDADTALAKNKALLMEAWDNAEITVDFKREQLEDMIFEAGEYSSEEDTGMGFIVDNFRVKSPTASKPGLVSADVLIYLDDAEDGFTLSKEIPATGIADDDDPQEDTPQTVDTSIDASTAKKELAEASHAISMAIYDFEVSNDTTRQDILNMAKNALPSGSHVTVTLDKADFSLTKASTTVNGTVSATLELFCGTQSQRTPVGKTIEPVVTVNSQKINEDRSAISKAISAMTFTNKVTKEDILQTALSAVRNGSKVVWKDNFYKKEATFKEKGELSGYLILTLEEETRELGVREIIPMLVRKMPTDISLNKEEWEVLRLVNVERVKDGGMVLTMHGTLQSATDIREAETAEVFSHTRPNGQKFNTVIPAGFNATTLGENIFQCPSHDNDAERAMNAWMNSEGHRANILRGGYDYIGIGMDDMDGIQIFAGWKKPITSVTTSAGTMHFEDKESMEKEYLICKDSDGVVTYMPLDAESMKKTDSGYTLNIRSDTPVVFTIGNAAADEPKTETTPAKKAAFSDVADSAYYANAVSWAVDRKITTGTTATTFSPDDTCTRAQILTFLWRAVGSPKASAENPFRDVSASDYYYDAAIWASEKGMVTGDTFAANTPCTRASTVVYLWKNAGAPQDAYTGTFEDVAAGSDYAQAVSWAVAQEVTSGTSQSTFSPEMICNRGQIVTFLNRSIG